MALWVSLEKDLPTQSGPGRGLESVSSPKVAPSLPLLIRLENVLLQQPDHWILVDCRARLGELLVSLPLDASFYQTMTASFGALAKPTSSETLNAVTSKRRELRPSPGCA